MMDYRLFKEVFVERISEFLPPMFEGYLPVVEKVNKVNEEKDAFIMRVPDRSETLSMPVIYLDELYEAFSKREDMDEILGFAAEIIIRYTGAMDRVGKDINLKDKIDSIIPNIVSVENNAEMLQNLPHRKIIDMAVIYRMIIRSGEDGFDSLIVNYDVLKEIGIDEDELKELAIRNFKRLFPAAFHIIDNPKGEFSDSIPRRIVFLSTEQSVFGSAHLICEEVMRKLAQRLDAEDIFIIPLSINEIAAVEADYAYLDMIRDFLFRCNNGETKKKEFLSRNIYRYSPDDGSLTVEASYSRAESSLYS